jgi:opacity protein-like surface antigen
MKIKYIIFIFAVFYNTSFAYAENYFSIGSHIGLQHNVGNPDSRDTSIQIDPQNNFLLGLSLKANYSFLFARSGADISYLINKGKVLENSSEIEYTKVYFLSVPLFLGYNFKILDIGNLYMGPGLSYFLARGKITSTSPGLSENVNATGWGFGFLTGIEYVLSAKLNFYFEWEYLNGQSKPFMRSSSSRNYDDVYIDFTGHRINFGIRYFLYN